MEWFTYMMFVLSTGVTGVIVAGLALILMIIALVRQESSLMVFAAFCTIPFTYVSGAWSGILLAIRLLPLLQFAAAFAIAKREMMLAWILPILPFIMVLSYLLRIVVSQFPK